MAVIGPPVGTIVDLVLGAAGVVFLGAGGYLLVLALAALRYKTLRPPSRPTVAWCVLVPAHNEADLIERCVASLAAQTYPERELRDRRHRRQLHRRHRRPRPAGRRPGPGPHRTRSPGQGPGAAVGDGHRSSAATRRPMPSSSSTPIPSPTPECSPVCARDGTRRAGGPGRVPRAPGDASTKTDLRAAAFMLVPPRSASRAGRCSACPCNLVGNGMLFTRDLLRRASVERVHERRGSRVLGAAATRRDPARVRRLRDRRGADPDLRPQRAHPARTVGGRPGARDPQRRHRSSCVRSSCENKGSRFDALVDLLVPPLGLLAVGAFGGLVVAALLAACRGRVRVARRSRGSLTLVRDRRLRAHRPARRACTRRRCTARCSSPRSSSSRKCSGRPRC